MNYRQPGSGVEEEEVEQYIFYPGNDPLLNPEMMLAIRCLFPESINLPVCRTSCSMQNIYQCIVYSVLEILNTVWAEKGESLVELPGQTTTKFQEDELKISLQYFYNITLFLNMLLQDPGRNFNFTIMKRTKPKPRWNTVHYVLMAKPVRHRTWTGL